MQNGRSLMVVGLLLALGLIVSTHLVSDAMRDIRMSHQIIKVRGYAERAVESDLADWKVAVKARNPEVSQAYASLAAGRQRVIEFLTAQGVSAEAVKMHTVQVTERMKRLETGHETSEIEAFDLSQTIEVKSTNVLNIAKISTAVAVLIGEGLELHSSAPNYYYTGVNEIKGDLLVEATRDARERARTLAEGSGVRLGPLRAARQGVFAIHSADSSGVSEEARDDTSSIAKKVTAIVTVDYAMK